MDRIAQIDTFSSYYQVSRETIKSLNNFEKILIESNKELNLIGKSTIKDIWHRHFLDSFQAIDFIDKNDKILVDIGSGAGFPGLVLAIAAKDKKFPLRVRLIEKSRKKAEFLEKIIKQLNLKVQVINENVLEKTKTLESDLLVIRAFKPLSIILKLIHNNATNWEKIIIFQGKTGKLELLEASKAWDIGYKQRVSITNSDSTILEINKLKKK